MNIEQALVQIITLANGVQRAISEGKTEIDMISVFKSEDDVARKELQNAIDNSNKSPVIPHNPQQPFSIE